MNKFKVIIAILMISAATLILPAFRPAQAIGVGVWNSINWDEFFTRLAKSLEVELAQVATNTFVNDAIGKITSSRQINQYDTYLKNVANQVYVSSLVSNQNSRDAYITRSVINDSLNFTNTHAPLDPLYTQAAMQTCNIYNVNNAPPGPQTYLFLANCPAQLGSSPQMQKVIYQDSALVTSAQAQQYATLDISQGQGLKTGYNCTTIAQHLAGQGPTPPAGAGSQTAQNTAAVNCAVQNPAAFASTYLDSEISGALNYQIKPADTVQAFADVISQTVSRVLFTTLINKGVANVFGEAPLPIALGPLPPITPPRGGPGGTGGGTTAAPFSQTQFQVLDGSGKILAGFNSIGTANFATISSGGSVVLRWNGSALPNASSAVLVNPAVGSGTNNFGTSVTTTITNITAATTYSLSIIDSSGNVLAIDTINIRVQ